MSPLNKFKMNKKYLTVLCISILFIFSSCVGQKKAAIFPVPDSGINPEEKITIIEYNDIIETKNGTASQMPAWLRSFLGNGIGAVEKLDGFNNKYAFIGINDGKNFAALTKWGDYFNVIHDFPLLAAVRIEKRMYLTASLYPNDEYGAFYEKMIQNAYGMEYANAVKEDVFWIKTKSKNDEEFSENYIFYVLITIEKNIMQTIIRNMIAKSSAAVTLTPSQTVSVNRLRNTFFEGF